MSRLPIKKSDDDLSRHHDEEYRGLLGSGSGNNASIASVLTALCRQFIISNRSDNILRRFSTPLLIGIGFLFGVVLGPHLSRSNSRNDYNNYISTIFSSSFINEGKTIETRDVHVSSMCRCPSDFVPVAYVHDDLKTIYQTVPKNNNPTTTNNHVGQQPPSKATGSYHKRYIHHPIEGCECRVGNGRLDPTPTKDMFLSQISRPYFENTCGPNNPATESQTSWDQMPDFGVEDKPIFAGILSYESPLSLNSSLHNWLDNDFFHRIAAQDVFVQLNHRSTNDDEILQDFKQQKLNNRHPMTILGSPEENLHPGLAISKFCRLAEQHPSSHPNGENLVLFLEKDWVIAENSMKRRPGELERLFRSAIALSQRGVPFISLRAVSDETDKVRQWNCPAEGVPWHCTTSHQHRWTNLPALIDCHWFLRYLEPFAIMSLNDPIFSCGRADGYCDWEKAMQDGRIAWTNSQWVVAHITRDGGSLFYHKEVDK